MILHILKIAIGFSFWYKLSTDYKNSGTTFGLISKGKFVNILLYTFVHFNLSLYKILSHVTNVTFKTHLTQLNAKSHI